MAMSEEITLKKATTPVEFCEWLEGYVVQRNQAWSPRIRTNGTRIRRFGWAPSLGANAEPDKVEVWRHDRTYLPEKGIDYGLPPRQLALIATMTRVKGGTQIIFRCDEELGISPGKFVVAMHELPDIEEISAAPEDQAIQEAVKESPNNRLSPQLAKVAHLIADGYENAEIADKTNLPLGTIQTYVKRIADQWGISSERDGLRKAARDKDFGDKTKS